MTYFLCRKMEGELGDKLESCGIKQKQKAEMRKKIHLLFLWGVIALFSSMAYAEEKILPKPIFKLTKGQGTEVCEAYLQRLNATEFFDNNPTQDRLNEPLLKDFADLKTVPMTTDEVLNLYTKLESFELFQDQNLLEKYYKKQNTLHKDEKGFTLLGQGEKQTINIIMEEHHQKPLVRYQSLLDLDNDGKAADTVIKVTRDPTSLNIAGLFIVDSKLQQVDEDRMKAIFADQEILQWPTVTQFPPIAAPINLFAYQGKYYFDGFQNLRGIWHRPIMLYQSPPMFLKVFIHEHHQTKQVCEYQWLNVEGTGIVYP